MQRFARAKTSSEEDKTSRWKVRIYEDEKPTFLKGACHLLG